MAPTSVDARRAAKFRRDPLALGRRHRGSRAKEAWGRAARWITEVTGSVWLFLAALLVIATWALTGPIFGFSDTWQLIINTGTTIVTFLMVFLIQQTQNRDTTAIQLKLNEIIAAIEGASNKMIRIEDLSEDELKAIAREYQELVSRAPKFDRRSTSVTEANGGEHPEQKHGE